MSADEFDPAIERLFARTPSMPDATLFNAEVERRLQKSSRFRVLAFAAAGVIGGVVAVREVLSINVSPSEGLQGGGLGQGLQAASLNLQGVVQSGLDQLGVGNVGMGSMTSMQVFWIAAGALIAVAAAGVMRLSQDV